MRESGEIVLSMGRVRIVSLMGIDIKVHMTMVCYFDKLTGRPQGKGVYTWENGNQYVGDF
jgi:hypothetical protein